MLEGDVGVMVLDGRAGSFSSSVSSPFSGQSKFLAFCILQGFVCLFVFLVFCKLKQVKTKLLLVQHNQETRSQSSSGFINIYVL